MILITDISGFVGQNLYFYLKSSGKAKIIGLSRKRLPTEDYRSVTYPEFFDNQSLSAQHYIHLAGKAHDLKNTANDQEYYEVNFGLTKKLLLNMERLQKLTESYIVSNAKIKDALGEELPFSAKDGMMKTFALFK